MASATVNMMAVKQKPNTNTDTEEFVHTIHYLHDPGVV